LSRTASLIPPPRFVRRSSTSEFRNGSNFSVKVGMDSAGAGVALAPATGLANGAGDAPVTGWLAAAGVGVGEEATACTRGGG
jgi:hypothetical protein